MKKLQNTAFTFFQHSSFEGTFFEKRRVFESELDEFFKNVNNSKNSENVDTTNDLRAGVERTQAGKNAQQLRTNTTAVPVAKVYGSNFKIEQLPGGSNKPNSIPADTKNTLRDNVRSPLHYSIAQTWVFDNQEYNDYNKVQEAKLLAYFAATGKDRRMDGFQEIRQKGGVYKFLRSLPFLSQMGKYKKSLSRKDFLKKGAKIGKFQVSEKYIYLVLETLLEFNIVEPDKLGGMINWIKERGEALLNMDEKVLKSLGKKRGFFDKIRNLFFKNPINKTERNPLMAGIFLFMHIAQQKDLGDVARAIARAANKDKTIYSKTLNSVYDVSEKSSVASLKFQKLLEGIKPNIKGVVATSSAWVEHLSSRTASWKDISTSVKQEIEKREFNLGKDKDKIYSIIDKGDIGVHSYNGEFGKGTVTIDKNGKVLINRDLETGANKLNITWTDNALEFYKQQGILNSEEVLKLGDSKVGDDGKLIPHIVGNNSYIIKDGKIIDQWYEDGKVKRITSVIYDGDTFNPQEKLNSYGLNTDISQKIIDLTKKENGSYNVDGYSVTIYDKKVVKVSYISDAGYAPSGGAVIPANSKRGAGREATTAGKKATTTIITFQYGDNLGSRLASNGYESLIGKIEDMKKGEKKEIGEYTVISKGDGNYSIEGPSDIDRVVHKTFTSTDDLTSNLTGTPYSQYESNIRNVFKTGESFKFRNGAGNTVIISKNADGTVDITELTPSGKQKTEIVTKRKKRSGMRFNYEFLFPFGKYGYAGIGGGLATGGMKGKFYAVVGQRVTKMLTPTLTVGGGWRFNISDTAGESSGYVGVDGRLKLTNRLSILGNIGSVFTKHGFPKIKSLKDLSKIQAEYMIGTTNEQLNENLLAKMNSYIQSQLTPEYLSALAKDSGLTQEEFKAISPYLTKLFAVEGIRNQIGLGFLGFQLATFNILNIKDLKNNMKNQNVLTKLKSLIGSITAKWVANIETVVKVTEDINKTNANTYVSLNNRASWRDKQKGRPNLYTSLKQGKTTRIFPMIFTNLKNSFEELDFEGINVYVDPELGDPNNYFDLDMNRGLIRLKEGVANVNLYGMKTISQNSERFDLFLVKENDNPENSENFEHYKHWLTSHSGKGENFKVKNEKWSNAPVKRDERRISNLKEIEKRNAEIKEAKARKSALEKKYKQEMEAYDHIVNNFDDDYLFSVDPKYQQRYNQLCQAVWKTNPQLKGKSADTYRAVIKKLQSDYQNRLKEYNKQYKEARQRYYKTSMYKVETVNRKFLKNLQNKLKIYIAQSSNRTYLEKLEYSLFRKYSAEQILSNKDAFYREFLSRLRKGDALYEYVTSAKRDRVPDSYIIDAIVEVLMFRTTPSDYVKGLKNGLDDWDTLQDKDRSKYNSIISKRFTREKTNRYLGMGKGNALRSMFREKDAFDKIKNATIDPQSNKKMTLSGGVGMTVAQASGKKIGWDVIPSSDVSMNHVKTLRLTLQSGAEVDVYIGCYSTCRNYSIYIKPVKQKRKPFAFKGKPKQETLNGKMVKRRRPTRPTKPNYSNIPKPIQAEQEERNYSSTWVSQSAYLKTQISFIAKTLGISVFSILGSEGIRSVAEQEVVLAENSENAMNVETNYAVNTEITGNEEDSFHWNEFGDAENKTTGGGYYGGSSGYTGSPIVPNPTDPTPNPRNPIKGDPPNPFDGDPTPIVSNQPAPVIQNAGNIPREGGATPIAVATAPVLGTVKPATNVQTAGTISSNNTPVPATSAPAPSISNAPNVQTAAAFQNPLDDYDTNA